jgi:energy-coupling factor transporter transmembrane protein EcfT
MMMTNNMQTLKIRKIVKFLIPFILLITLYILYIYNSQILLCEESDSSNFKMFDMTEGNSNFNNNEFNISQSNPSFNNYYRNYNYDMLNISLAIVIGSGMLIMAIATKSFD